jgi:hypothetical protein
MTKPTISTLFANDIRRNIEEVIKVDQNAEDVLRAEIDEYVATDSIRRHYVEIFERYRETPNKPHEGIAVWVSGFFGSGKSSFAKMLGLTIANRPVGGDLAAQRFATRAGDKKIEVLLHAINEQIPTHAVIFDVSTDRGIRSGNQTLTEIMYGLFLKSLGYAKDLDLSELEIALEDKGELPKFEAEYSRIFNKEWADEKDKIAFSLGQASRVIHTLDPATWPSADSWTKAAKNRGDITPGKLAERATELMKRRRPGQSLMFVVDEVGQFVARDVQKMLDLQAIVQSLGVKGRGKHWIVVTSQEKLNELVSGLDDKKIELARLMDRFPLQVHLEPSDISEVTSKRVLAKNAAAESALGKLFDDHRGRLTENTRLTADIRLPELARQNFVDLYPLLPYQIDLIIQVVSGLRTQGGAGRHVGGANRTIIKLAQQLLIHQGVDLASHPVGELVRLDQVYDLVEGNIGSEIREKIHRIEKEIPHPLAQPVAKAICLLQYVKSVHRTAENIAAALHPDVAADSRIAEVKDALRDLEAGHMVRRGDDGYRIPTPAEDDWERTRMGIAPRGGDTQRLYQEMLVQFWQPQPSHNFLDTKLFKAGLAIHGRDAVDGDLIFQVHFADGSKAFQDLAAELRTRSQQERKHVFWAVRLDEAIDREAVELFRCKEMISRRERDTVTQDQTSLIAEERLRLRRHQEELKRLLRAACLSGSVYFRGNDRSPGDRAADVGKTASEVLGEVLPQVFDRFKDAAAKTSDLKKGLDALFAAENLNGLPPVFSALRLLRDEKGKTVFAAETGPLAEVMHRIEERATYGEIASGKYLTEELAKEPFGWDFEAVRLFVLSLLRSGKIEATSKSQTIDSATSVEAREAFQNNNLFRSSAFKPRSGGCEFSDILQAAEHFREVFGTEIKEIEEGLVATQIREALAREEPRLSEVLLTLGRNGLPGSEPLDAAVGAIRNIRGRRDCPALQEFSATHKMLKDAIGRTANLLNALTEPHLLDLARAKKALAVAWAFLKNEPDLDEALRAKAEELDDLLRRETFFRELPKIDQHARAVDAEYARRYEDALEKRVTTYAKALERLTATTGWAELDDAQKSRISAPLRRCAEKDQGSTIPQLRSDRDACETRLRDAIAELRQILEGERVVTVPVGTYFAGGIESEEQLEAALEGIREECARLIGAGKKVFVQ